MTDVFDHAHAADRYHYGGPVTVTPPPAAESRSFAGVTISEDVLDADPPGAIADATLATLRELRREAARTGRPVKWDTFRLHLVPASRIGNAVSVRVDVELGGPTPDPMRDLATALADADRRRNR